MKYLFLVISLIVFIGCSSNPVKPTIEKVDTNTSTKAQMIKLEPKAETLHDLMLVPQGASIYTPKIIDAQELFSIQKKYERYYFRTWNMDKADEKLSDVKWPFAVYNAKRNYGENLQALKQKFFDDMLEKSNFDKYATKNLYGITLREVNIRAFPTIRPVLSDPKEAGEGFPFDYMQNSTLHANKPILISHYSKDKAWAYVFSSFTSGWIKTSEFVVLNKTHTKLYQDALHVSIVKEDVPIYTEDNKFLFNSKIGQMFALVSQDKDFYTILTISSYKDNKPLFNKSKISKKIATKQTLKFTKDNLEKIVNEVIKTNYGWGGMYGQRDCSSMLRDLYAPFGIWLPRNSYQQSKVGKVISLKNLSDEQKIKLIKEKAIAFKTLLYKKGHIVLYVGTFEEKVIILHNTWGVKTKKDGIEGRFIIGKPIFSTLKVGSNLKNYDKDASILKNLKSMNILTN